MQNLPTLKQSLLPAFLSIAKNKNRFESDYEAERTFVDSVDSKHLQEFRYYFGYKNELPLTYFYILAQRAQLPLMVAKSFPVPAVGLVHLDNEIYFTETPFDVEKPFEVNAFVSMEGKKPGSVVAMFEVNFYQEGVKVIGCKSLYLSKRKSKLPKAKKEKEPFHPLADASTFPLEIPGSKGNSYANLSGDHNPIHTSNLLAKLFGFKRKIIHGWYTVSYAVAQIENDNNIQARRVACWFQQPVFLPAKATLNFTAAKPNITEGFSHISFNVTDTNNTLLHVGGSIVF